MADRARPDGPGYGRCHASVTPAIGDGEPAAGRTRHRQRVSDPLSPPPVRTWRPEYLPAYLGNGLIGLRCGRIPFRDGTTMANGFAGLGIDDGVEGFARVPFALGADISLDGVRLSMAPERVRFVEQRYDFERPS